MKLSLIHPWIGKKFLMKPLIYYRVYKSLQLRQRHVMNVHALFSLFNEKYKIDSLILKSI